MSQEAEIDGCGELLAAEAIRPRTALSDEKCRSYLEGVLAKISSSRAVQHPFFGWYADNNLRRDQEEVLFYECYHWFSCLPFYIASISNLTRDYNVLKEITHNIYDEVCGPRTHADLYVDFLSGVGLNLEGARKFKPSRATKELNEGMARLYSSPPLEKALGALFFDEAMSAVMVSQVNKGLAHHGYSDRVRFFWECHINIEVGHSNSVFNAIAPYIHSTIGRETFESGVGDLEALVEKFWDAVIVRLDLDRLIR